MKKIILSLLYLCGIAMPTAYAQQNPVIPLPADAAELFKYNNIPVSMYTGVPQISYPIYEVNTGKIKLPITLSYHASGIKVDQKATMVGLGWSLIAGGTIARQIRGGADENLPYGWFNNPLPLDSIRRLRDALQVQPWYDGYVDTQPDFFNFNFTGKSGRFIWSRSRQEFVTAPYQPVSIRHNEDNTYQITDDDGNRYLFTYPVYTEGSGQSIRQTLSAWNLTKIISADAADTILINYTVDPTLGEKGNIVTTFTKTYHQNTDRENSGDYIMWKGEPEQSSTVITSGSQPRIKEIIFRQGKVVFFANTLRVDYTGTALDSIVVYSNENNSYERVRKVSFAYDYFYNRRNLRYPMFMDYRLRLLSFTREDINGEQPETYRFGYDTTRLPITTSCATDWWGFYNGKELNLSLMPAQPPHMDHISYLGSDNLGKADRNADSNYIMAGILNSVTYPTGGYTTYKYGINKYRNWLPDSITQTLAYANVSGKGSSTFPEEEVTVTKDFSIRPPGNRRLSYPATITMNYSTYSKSAAGHSQSVSLKDLTTGEALMNWSTTDFKEEDAHNKTHSVIYTYQFDTSHTYQIVTTVIDRETTSIEVMVKMTYSDDNYKELAGGGIHVDSIATYNIDNTLQTLDVYRYGSNENGHGYMPTSAQDLTSNIFTGITVVYDPPGATNFCLGELFGSELTYVAQSSFPSISFQGAAVVYPQVTKYSFNGNKPNGRTVYFYDLPRENDNIIISDPTTFGKAERLDNSLSEDAQQQLSGEIYYRYNDADGSFTRLKTVSYSYDYYKIQYDTALYIYRAIQNRINFPCPTRPASDYQNRDFRIKSGGRRLLSSTETNYDDNGTVQSSTTTYTYNKHLYPQTINQLNSKGEPVVTTIYYPGDHTSSDVNAAVLNKMVNKNMLRQAYWQGSSVNNNLLSYKHTLFSDKWGTNDSLIAPKIDSSWQLGNDNTLPPNTIAYQSYDKYGNIRQIRDDKGITSSYSWSANGTYPLSQTAGASYNQILYDGFEDPDTWKGIFQSSTQAHTGKYAGLMSTPGSSVNSTWINISLSTATRFRYSGWIYSSAPSAAISLLMKKTGETGAYTYIDNVSTSETGKWIYLEKEYDIPAGISTITIRLENSGSENVWYDDIKLRPSFSQMSTFTFNPLIGMSSKSDEGNHTLYYEFDGLNRLKLIRNKDRNILKMYCYNYAGEIDRCAGPVYYNGYKSQDFTKHCTYGGSSTTITYGINAGTYTSLISVEDANNKALEDIARNGQAYADKMGDCTYYLSHQMTDTFYSKTCSANGTPVYITYTLEAGADTSVISQADANEKAKQKLISRGQAQANSQGKCYWLNEQVSKVYQKNNCATTGMEGSNVEYTVAPGQYFSYTSVQDANAMALKEVTDSGLIYANRNGGCYYYNDKQTAGTTKQCDPGYKGSYLEYTTPARHDSSTISKSDANTRAYNFAVQTVMNLANTSGQCQKCNILYSKKADAGSLDIFSVSVFDITTGNLVFIRKFDGPDNTNLALCDVIAAGSNYRVTITTNGSTLYATVNGSEKAVTMSAPQSWILGPPYDIVFSNNPAKIYSNVSVNVPVRRNNCTGNATGMPGYYTVPANVYTTTISQKYADSMAVVNSTSNAQNYINQYGYCLPAGYNLGIVRASTGGSPGAIRVTAKNNRTGASTTIADGVPTYTNLTNDAYTITVQVMDKGSYIANVNGTVYSITGNGAGVSFSFTPNSVIAISSIN